eukprot:gnl/Chilomastix_cuspidata/4064.p1 GENE.gnl/Chilomastix_cuspidata/4064~~gnl/Chilomastix_cuspidata/4064.p1  ORF type:complete len:104 (+),score=38.91 gnl/Chilomastix_cuspidata/4064:107-418(+)
MSHYFRVRHGKATIFLHCNATDTVLDMKENVKEILDISDREIQLRFGSRILNDDEAVELMGVPNESELLLVLADETGAFGEPHAVPYPAARVFGDTGVGSITE